MSGFIPIPIYTRSWSLGGHLSPKEAVAFVVLSAVASVVIVWLGITIISWLMPISGNPSLRDVLREQWEYIKTKRIF